MLIHNVNKDKYGNYMSVKSAEFASKLLAAIHSIQHCQRNDH